MLVQQAISWSEQTGTYWMLLLVRYHNWQCDAVQTIKTDKKGYIYTKMPSNFILTPKLPTSYDEKATKYAT